MTGQAIANHFFFESRFATPWASCYYIGFCYIRAKLLTGDWGLETMLIGSVIYKFIKVVVWFEEAQYR